MGIISADSLNIFSKYYESKVKLKVIHFCPLDGREDDPKCKRIVVTSDVSLTTQPLVKTYLVIVFYGSYAKTPFKKSALKSGQLFTLHRFETGVMPKNKVFKCDGHILKDFYEPLILVKPEFEPIIKMLVSLREESFVIPNDLSEDNEILAICDTKCEDNTNQRVSPIKSNEVKVTKTVKNPVKKRLKFESSEDETEISSEDGFDTNCRRTIRSATNGHKKRIINRQSNNLQKEVTINQLNRRQIECNTDSEQNIGNSVQTKERYEYRTLLEVHNLMPVSGKKYCHIYGILRRRDFKSNIIYLRDEKAYSFTIHLRPGNSTFRDYPASKPGDILRIHRILLAPNTMDIICTDPKDVVVFQAFQNSESFSPIHTSLKPSFEDCDRHRKQELEEWFSDELTTNENLSEKATSNGGYTDLAVQVLRVTTSRDRTYLEVWDTTRPVLKTLKCEVSTYEMNLTQSEEELIRIINENKLSIVVTVYEQHSNDAQNIKPFDFIVLFNVKIMADKYNNECYNYTLNSGYHYGKCIRFVKQNSCLGKKLSARIEEYKVMSAVNVTHSLTDNEFPSPSLPIDFDDNQNEILKEIQMSAEEEECALDEVFDNQFSQLDEMFEVLQTKQKYLPLVYDVLIPNNTIQIDELLSKGVDKQLYKVKARVINFISKELNDIISINCCNPDCHRLITLRQALIEDPSLKAVISSQNDPEFTFDCFKCKQNTAVLSFRFLFCLEDNRHNKIIAELCSPDAEVFFKRKTIFDVLHKVEDYHYIELVFQYLCPKISSLDSIDSNNVLIHWVIEPSNVSENHFRYLIKTGIPIETSDKCVGHNFS